MKEKTSVGSADISEPTWGSPGLWLANQSSVLTKKQNGQSKYQALLMKVIVGSDKKSEPVVKMGSFI